MSRVQVPEPAGTLGVEPFVAPEELTAEVRARPLPLEVETLSETDSDGVFTRELLLVSDVVDGEKVAMHAWLSMPLAASRAGHEATRLPATIVIPGGFGRMDPSYTPWFARTCEALTLGVDWLGAGSSPPAAGLTPWPNQVRFEGEDYRSSYQYANVCALLRATNFLLEEPYADPDMLAAVGGSWGGFYCWLLAGIDERFTHIFPTFGCGFLDLECNQEWEADFVSLGRERSEEWLRAFDPGRRAHLIKAAVFYEHATNDKFYSLLSAMRTYHRVRAPKRLLLAQNQDHFMHPFDAPNVALARAVFDGTLEEFAPSIGDLKWVEGTNRVEVQVETVHDVDVSIVYSAGSYAPAFGRFWRDVGAVFADGRWSAQVPVVDPSRELWVYAHATRRNALIGASSAPQRIVPIEHGFLEATQEFDPVFSFDRAPFATLPVSDRVHPEMRLVEDGQGATDLAITFGPEPPTRPRRGVAFCLEGDILAARGYNGVDLTVKLPRPDDLEGLEVVIVTDLHALAEQNYVAPLARYGDDFSEFRVVRVPFADLVPVRIRRHWFFEPPMQPLDVGRICAVGFTRPEDVDYRGEVWLRRIEVVCDPAAGAVRRASGVPLPWPPRRLRLNEPDLLAVTGQGALADE